jgi:hypothetical protein
MYACLVGIIQQPHSTSIKLYTPAKRHSPRRNTEIVLQMQTGVSLQLHHIHTYYLPIILDT